MPRIDSAAYFVPEQDSRIALSTNAHRLEETTEERQEGSLVAEGHYDGLSPPEESGGVNGLTPIHRPIHCGATEPDPDREELDNLDIRNFVNILAEVAMAIATRRLNKNGGADES